MKSFGIILLASERSGSNLLRILLGNHSNILAPIAPHLMNIFYPIKHYYCNLIDRQKNIRKDQAKNIVNEHTKAIVSKQRLINKIVDKRRSKYLSSISYMDRVKNYIKFNMYKVIKKYFFQYLGSHRITFIIRNYINK